MTTKVMAAGDLFPYMFALTNYKGEEREQLPELVNGPAGKPVERLKLAEERLQKLAPPWVSEDRRRRVNHCRRHLTHLIIGFKEGHAQTAPHIYLVIEAVEKLLLAGLPPDALDFSWVLHAQEQNSHLHGAMVRALLPAGGPYEHALDSSLVEHFDFLISRKLGLVDPLIPDLGRSLVYGGRFSNKGELRKQVREIVTETRTRCQVQGNPRNRREFLALLSALGFEILAAPDRAGRPKWRTPEPLGRAYHNMLAVRAGGCEKLIWLGGAVCRAGFHLDLWNAEMRARIETYEQEWLRNPGGVFRKFGDLLEKRVSQQQSRYGVDPRMPGMIGVEDFAWLNPANSGLPDHKKSDPSDAIFAPDFEAEELANFSPEIITPYHFADGAGEEVRNAGVDPWCTAEWPAEPKEWWLPEGSFKLVEKQGNGAPSTRLPLLPLPGPGSGEQAAPPALGGGAATTKSGQSTGKKPETAAKRRPTVHSAMDAYFPLRTRLRVRHPKALRLGLKSACAHEDGRFGDPAISPPA